MKHNWEYKRLGDLCDFIGGGTPSKSNEDYYTGNIPWATVRDMGNFKLSKTELSITEDAVANSATNILPQGMIVISTHVGLGKICELMQETAINQDLKGISILNNSIDKYFLVYWYRSIADYIISKGRGATVKGVTLDFMRELNIPVPSPEEQERIVEELDALNGTIAKCRELLATLDSLAQSLFYDTFGDPVTNPKGWDNMLWGNIFDSILGKMLDKNKQNPDDLNIEYLANQNVQWGYFQLENLPKMTFNAKEIEKFSLKDGDLLICEGGESARCAVWKNINRNILFQKAVHRARPKRQQIINTVFVRYWLEFYKKNDGLKNFITKSTIEHLTGEKLKKVMVPVPPYSLQEDFARKIETIEAEKKKVEATMAVVQTLLDSRMDYWFND